MIRDLRIILRNAGNDLLRGIIVMLFVGASTLLMNVSLSRYTYQEYINSLVRDCGLYDSYMYAAPPDKSAYFRVDSPTDLRAAALSYVQDGLAELMAEGVVEAFYGAASFNGPVSDDPDERAYYLLYPGEFLRDISFPTPRGVWFDKLSQNEPDNTCPAAVIGSGLAKRYKPGGMYKFRGLATEVRIIGVLSDNAMVLKCGAGGNGTDLNTMFRSGNDVIIVCADDISIPNGSGAALIKASGQGQQRVLECISDIVYTFTFRELADTAYENNRLISEMQSVVFVLMMVVCIAGVSSSNLMKTIQCIKKYAVYFMCGMDWRHCIRISAIEGAVGLAIPALMGYAAFLRWCAEQDYSALRVTSANPLLSAGFVICIYALTSLVPLIDIKNTSPVRIISGS